MLAKGNGQGRPSRFGKRRRSTVAVIACWALAIAWACLIFYMSSCQSSGLSTGFFGEVKAFADSVIVRLGLPSDSFNVLCHFMEYLVFGFLLANAAGARQPARRALFLAVVLASAYGASDEFHQYFVPTRVCDPLDWLTDTAGGLAGALLCLPVLKRRQ